MFNVIKSVALWTVIIGMLTLSIILIVKTIKRKKDLNVETFVMRIICYVLIACAVLPLLPYANPFYVHPKLEYVTTVENADVVHHTGIHWYADYEFYDFWGNYYNSVSTPNPDFTESDEFPETNLKEYTYIYSVDRPIEDLYYSVWDVYGTPVIDFGTSPKFAKVVFKDTPETNNVYIYRIPRTAIENESITGRSPYDDKNHQDCENVK